MMTPFNGLEKSEKGKSAMSNTNIQKIIKGYIERLAKEKFTGEVVFRLRFNQGGIRDSKITLEKSL